MMGARWESNLLSRMSWPHNCDPNLEKSFPLVHTGQFSLIRHLVFIYLVLRKLSAYILASNAIAT